MNKPLPIAVGHSACPHDCPSTCALDVEILEGGQVGRLRGAADNDYTAGVICAKVARYAERIHHADRLLKPLQRVGEKGGGTNMAWTGWFAGAGAMRGADPREIGKSDCVVIWGTNAVATQVNVMTHAARARKERGAKIVVVDIYDNATMKQADFALKLRPGTDAALACALMHVAFRDGTADRDYLARYTDDPAGLEMHLETRTPEWAAAITGLTVA